MVSDVCLFVCWSGSPPAAVRRRGGDEALRSGHHQCQPAHFPAQQEILWEIRKKKKEKDKRATDSDLNHKTPTVRVAESPDLNSPGFPTHSLLHFSHVPMQINVHYFLLCGSP